MNRNLIALAAGIVFGVGLGLAQMVNPHKVRDFLDVAGTWDPSLGFVMGAAVAVYFVAWRISLGRSRPLFAEVFRRPTRTVIADPRLLGGAAVFGIGWGLVGFCPGPAIASLAYLLPQSLVFVVAMAAGSWAGGLVPNEPIESDAAMHAVEERRKAA